MRAVDVAAFSRAVRVEVQSSFALQTWFMEDRDRLEARRRGIRAVEVVDVGGEEGGGSVDSEEAIFDSCIEDWRGISCSRSKL